MTKDNTPSLWEKIKIALTQRVVLQKYVENPLRFASRATCITMKQEGYGIAFFLGRFHVISPGHESYVLPVHKLITIWVVGFRGIYRQKIFLDTNLKEILLPKKEVQEWPKIRPSQQLSSNQSAAIPKVSLPKINVDLQPKINLRRINNVIPSINLNISENRDDSQSLQ